MPWTLDGAGAAKGTPVGVNVVPKVAWQDSHWPRLNPDPWTVPNNGVEYSVYRVDGIAIPSNAQMGMVTARTSARAAYNSAGSWNLYVRYGTPAGALTGWEKVTYTVVHNLGDQYASFNTTLQTWITATGTGFGGAYNRLDVYVNAAADAAGAPWSLHAGSIRIDWVGV